MLVFSLISTASGSAGPLPARQQQLVGYTQWSRSHTSSSPAAPTRRKRAGPRGTRRSSPPSARPFSSQPPGTLSLASYRRPPQGASGPAASLSTVLGPDSQDSKQPH